MSKKYCEECGEEHGVRHNCRPYLERQRYQQEKQRKIDLASRHQAVARELEPCCLCCDKLQPDWNYCPNCGRKLAKRSD